MARAAINVTEPGAPSSARREEIITVASALLSSKGLALSLQDIADELGITYNALYHHFKSRDDLLLHCFLRSSRALEESLHAAEAGAGTGLDKVMGFLQTFLDRAQQSTMPPGRYSVALREDAQRIVAKRSLALQAKLQTLVEEGLADGSIADCDPLVTAVWVLHTLYWWPEEAHRHRTAEEVGTSVLALVRRSLAA